MAGNGRRGFASMDAEKRREIARKGGRAAHEKGTAHEFTPEEAREAGRKGGTAVSRDRRHMAEIGREGGRSRNGGQGTRNGERAERGEFRFPSPGGDGASLGRREDVPPREDAAEEVTHALEGPANGDRSTFECVVAVVAIPAEVTDEGA
jgi:uncharacterized protein